jgi:predicted RNA-binding protein with PUA domain
MTIFLGVIIFMVIFAVLYSCRGVFPENCSPCGSVPILFEKGDEIFYKGHIYIVTGYTKVIEQYSWGAMPKGYYVIMEKNDRNYTKVDRDILESHAILKSVFDIAMGRKDEDIKSKKEK